MVDTVACIKRVPNTGASIPLTEDGEIDTSTLGFTVSPHEECAVEEAVQLAEEHGGTATALTLGSEEATEQLHTAVARNVDEAILLGTDGSEWRPTETARAIASTVGDAFDLILFGNESADTENYQVPVRLAHELDLPCVTAIKDLEIEERNGELIAIAKREVTGGSEIYELSLPAVVAVKEGINSPRYASMRSRMQASRQEIERIEPDCEPTPGSLERIRFEAPPASEGSAEILGDGPPAATNVVAVLEELGVL